MEENNSERVEKSTGSSWLKTKWLIIVGIVVTILVAIAVIIFITGGKTKPVKEFVSAYNEKNALKLVALIDFTGSGSWVYYEDIGDFSKKDYEEFIENYKEYDKEYEKIEKRDTEEYFKDAFYDIDYAYKTYKLKIEKFKKTRKLGKNLYAVEAVINSVAIPKDKNEKEEDITEDMMFIIYKDKIVYLEGLY